jgi:hypothetical protein
MWVQKAHDWFMYAFMMGCAIHVTAHCGLSHPHRREQDVKRVYYMSMEFLMGRSLLNALFNLDVAGAYGEALAEMGYNLETLVEQERDAVSGAPQDCCVEHLASLRCAVCHGRICLLCANTGWTAASVVCT